MNLHTNEEKKKIKFLATLQKLNIRNTNGILCQQYNQENERSLNPFSKINTNLKYLNISMVPSGFMIIKKTYISFMKKEEENLTPPP